MEQVFLADLECNTDQQIRKHLAAEWEAPQELIDSFDILVAYESVGSWGCDSSAWYLLRERKSGDLFEVHGSHCSCYGFEEQFTPEKTSVEYLKSDKFYFSKGGYDDDDQKHDVAVKQYLALL